METEQIAEICHEANRTYCRLLGDYTQVAWDLAPLWQRQSAIAGVKTALENPTATPENMHQSWSALKIAEGWKYGATKDPETKTHPCLVAYSELPEPQRRKDSIFLAIVRAFT
jgi:hypothetical protein